MILVEGRIVHFVLDRGPRQGEHRPAVVVRVPAGTWHINIRVFLDEHDGILDYHSQPKESLFLHEVSYDASATPGTWHHIEEKQ
jgi:hypothetical protein